jgi:hypothetical protein
MTIKSHEYAGATFGLRTARTCCLAASLALVGTASAVSLALAEDAKPKSAETATDMRGSHGGEASSAAKDVDHSQMDHSKMDHSQHAGHEGHEGHKMVLDDGGMVMNWNDDTPPRDCKDGVSEDVEFKVYAGRKYAKPGQSFGFSTNEWNVKPCARVKITLVNEDKIRHQWMMHGLPRYIYPQAMFHLEAAGGQTRSGTFIVPSSDETLLVHCDMAQHMEKGLKGQLKIGAGSGDLPSVPGISAARVQDPQEQRSGGWQVALLLGGLLLGVGIGGGLLGRGSK